MPSGTKVDECFQKLRKDRGDEHAARICQASTHEALATGRAPKHSEGRPMKFLGKCKKSMAEYAELSPGQKVKVTDGSAAGETATVVSIDRPGRITIKTESGRTLADTPTGDVQKMSECHQGCKCKRCSMSIAAQYFSEIDRAFSAFGEDGGDEIDRMSEDEAKTKLREMMAEKFAGDPSGHPEQLRAMNYFNPKSKSGNSYSRSNKLRKKGRKKGKK
jgi:hypothetical protein